VAMEEIGEMEEIVVMEVIAKMTSKIHEIWLRL